jgi:hypothetical protein
MPSDLRMRFEWKPQDFWIGVYTEVRMGKIDDWPYDVYERPFRHAWICLLPMIPLHLSWRTGGDDAE